MALRQALCSWHVWGLGRNVHPEQKGVVVESCACSTSSDLHSHACLTSGAEQCRCQVPCHVGPRRLCAFDPEPAAYQSICGLGVRSGAWRLQKDGLNGEGWCPRLAHRQWSPAHSSASARQPGPVHALRGLAKIWPKPCGLVSDLSSQCTPGEECGAACAV